MRTPRRRSIKDGHDGVFLCEFLPVSQYGSSCLNLIFTFDCLLPRKQDPPLDGPLLQATELSVEVCVCV
jgi:hypothetical protein